MDSLHFFFLFVPGPPIKPLVDGEANYRTPAPSLRHLPVIQERMKFAVNWRLDDVDLHIKANVTVDEKTNIWTCLGNIFLISEIAFKNLSRWFDLFSDINIKADDSSSLHSMKLLTASTNSYKWTNSNILYYWGGGSWLRASVCWWKCWQAW